ncbi:cellular communication network factor 1, like 1 [Brienomyrus brachyistius]|uniref:cellular communication network factor 1, like 1 n=1 Tax=Brienomyrus brachyistius TaxID=42636 RepID=UPI0020B2D40A|nr:cellular communication network factor 1, like 1 [Brienomyrus brachyistius]
MFALMLWRQTGFCALIFLLCAALGVDGTCPQQCSCPPAPPACPPGVSWVLNACGCCRVCARQFNQDCGPDQPCDHIKGLRCQMGAGGDPGRGLCRAEAQGRPCEFDGRLYQHGEDFEPNCQHQCSCMDGVVGCMPLCPHRVSLPTWHCARPRLARPPGRCCEEWLCDDDNAIAEELPEAWPGAPSAPRPHPDPASNELLASSPLEFSVGAPMQNPQSHALLASGCFPQITDWSPCSATCGMGVSSRVTNDNVACRLIKETRLCQVRPCNMELTPPLRAGRKCERTVRPRKPIRLTFAGCSTARQYRPRFCGSCDDGRCCIPSVTRTIRLHFLCPGPKSGGFTRDIMWIQQCRCDVACPGPAPSASPTLPSDIHTFDH